MNAILLKKKKILILFIGIAIVLIIGLSAALIFSLGKKNQEDTTTEEVGISFDEAYQNTVNATNYKIQFTISKDDSSLVFISDVDGSYQQISMQKITPEDSILSNYFVDYENLDLYYLSDVGNTKDHFEGIYNLKAIFDALAKKSSTNEVDANTVEYTIANNDAYNYMFTYLDIVKEIADIDFDSIKDDVVITVKRDGNYLSSISYDLNGIHSEYLFSNFNEISSLTLPEVTVIEQKEDETGIILPEED